MKDQLGNTRVSFNESAVIQQTDFYYLFEIKIQLNNTILN